MVIIILTSILMIKSTHKSKRKNNLFSKMFKEITENKFVLEQEEVCIEFRDCMVQIPSCGILGMDHSLQFCLAQEHYTMSQTRV